MFSGIPHFRRRNTRIRYTSDDDTIETGYIDDYDPPGVGRPVTISVALSCGHTHTLRGIQTAEGYLHGEGYRSVTPSHTSNAAAKVSRRSALDPVPSWDGCLVC